MFRKLNATKDTYITNVITDGKRRTAANVGQAGTLDLFKKFNVSQASGEEGDVVEDSSILIKFDFDSIQDLQNINFSSPSFKCFLSMKNAYGGQTTPSNYTIKIFPLNKSFDEGRGSDVYAFLDKDTANYLTASSSPTVGWETPGAYLTGSVGDVADIIVDFSSSQRIERGDEDLYVDVSSIVSASLAGILANHGFKIQFDDVALNDEKTYFVKRFGSRQVNNLALKPSLILQYDDRIQDDTGDLFFNRNQNLFLYNRNNGNLENLSYDSNEITGSNSLIVELAASRSVQFPTSSFSISHDMVITYMTRSISYFSTSFSASQYEQNNNYKTGIYNASFFIDSNEQELKDFLSGSSEQVFRVKWKDLNEEIVFSEYSVNLKTNNGNNFNNNVRNTVVNITNLKNTYRQNERATLRVFAMDLQVALPTSKSPMNSSSKILRDLKWSIRKPFTGETVIPFSEATKTSYDIEGMYFDLFFEDLDRNQVYEIELLVTEENGKTTLIQNQGFRFRIL
jgi:hypothetical protein